MSCDHILSSTSGGVGQSSTEPYNRLLSMLACRPTTTTEHPIAWPCSHYQLLTPVVFTLSWHHINFQLHPFEHNKQFCQYCILTILNYTSQYTLSLHHACQFTILLCSRFQLCNTKGQRWPTTGVVSRHQARVWWRETTTGAPGTTGKHVTSRIR